VLCGFAQPLAEYTANDRNWSRHDNHPKDWPPREQSFPVIVGISGCRFTGVEIEGRHDRFGSIAARRVCLDPVHWPTASNRQRSITSPRY